MNETLGNALGGGEVAPLAIVVSQSFTSTSDKLSNLRIVFRVKVVERNASTIDANTRSVKSSFQAADTSGDGHGYVTRSNPRHAVTHCDTPRRVTLPRRQPSAHFA